MQPARKDPVGRMVMLTKLSLKESEVRYRRLFETAQDGILILDSGTGLIEDVNPYLSTFITSWKV